MLLRAARYAQTCGCLSRQHHASTLLLCLAYRMRLKDTAGRSGRARSLRGLVQGRGDVAHVRQRP